jgi:hypothetical protein
LQQSDREPNRDGRTFADRALHFERAATNLGSLSHHRHAVVAFRTGCPGVEPAAVVLESQDDVLALRGDLHRHLGRIGVLESIHDPFAGDVEHEQGDRRGQIDVLHVTLETDV